MGLSFLSLLYLQVSYIEEMMKTRKEQFDSAVRNSLDQVSKDVEYAETMRWLVEDISDAERKALTENNTSLGQNNVVRGTQRFQVKSRDGKIISDFELRVMKIKPSELPKAMVRGRNTIPQTSNSMLEAIKNRYMYQRALLDEVVLDMIRRASDKSIGDRVRFRDLDDYLKSNLYNNGIDLPYHFAVIDKDGREVYRCADYEAKGSEESYQQALFKNDPPAKMSILKVHFPGKKDYIFDSISFIEMQVYRSSGAGGQHINKTSSAVRLIHKPTGIVVSCQTQRSQFQNRDYAMEMLKAKLYQIAKQQHMDKIDDIKGVQNEIAWGHQIRSYVFMPYTMVKDHRTNYETGNVDAVMDGDLDGFIFAYLKAASRGELQDT